MSGAPRPVRAVLARAGYRTEVAVGPFTLLADEPADRGGSDTGPTPHQLVAAGLASCTAMTLRMYAERHALPLEGVEVAVEERRPTDATRGPIAFDIRVRLDGPLDEAARASLLSVAARCPVHRTLGTGAELTLELEER